MSKRPAEKLISPDVLAKLIAARLDDMNIYFEVKLNQDGSINNESEPAIETLRKWIDRFGHAYYESRADHEIKADEDNVRLLQCDCQISTLYFLFIFHLKIALN